MQVGDLVRFSSTKKDVAGLVVGIVEKKCWRTGALGNKIDWNEIDPEPHAILLIGENYLTIPIVDLEIVSASK